MATLHELPTPSVLVDRAKLAANIRSMQEACTAHGVELRPHIKTHKMVAVGRMQLEAGARGYLVKNGAFEEFILAIRLLAAGRIYFNTSVGPDFTPVPQGSPLTAREQTILGLVAQGLSSKSIAERLELSPRTVENHRQNIMKKLNLRSATALVGYAAKQRLV